MQPEVSMRLSALGIILVGGVIFTAMYMKNNLFERECSGRLRRASNASSLAIAKEELGAALKFIEDKSLTSGSTHVFIRSSTNDVGFWYKNLKAAQEELNKIGPEVSQLEVTNILLKFRETISDHSNKTETVILPDEIVYYPNVFLWWVLGFLAAICLVLGVFIFIASFE